MTEQQYFRTPSAVIFTVLLFAGFLILFSKNETVRAAESHIIAQQDIAPLGLSRVWFNQIALDPVRSKAVHAILEGDTVFIVSDNAQLTAIDSETGKTLWSRGLGERDSFYQEPAANSRMVAVQNATDLFIFDRRNGKLLLSVNLPGTSSTSCEISENYVYIPMINGRLAAYSLADRETVKADKGSDEDAQTSTPLNGEQPDTDTAGNADNDAAQPLEKDDVLENIKKQFAQAKSELYPVEKPEPKEIPIVLQKISGIPIVTQSFGIITVKPKIASQIIKYTEKDITPSHEEIITWVNDRGFFLAANITLSREKISLQYKIDTSGQNYFLGSDRIAQREIMAGKEIVSQPVLNQSVYIKDTEKDTETEEIPSTIVFGTKTGFVIAVRDRTGEVIWQFAASGPVIERIGVIGTDVYAPTTEGLHAIDISPEISDRQKWFARGVVRFVAASKTRIYGMDGNSRLIVLDRETGQVLRSFNARKYGKILFNIETDRLYLITETGLIQCLAERQLQEDAAAAVVQHRYTCAQNVDLSHGKDVPELYWIKDVVKQPEEPADKSAETKTEEKTE